MASTKYIIVSDESSKNGQFYSYFYGGCILKESLYENISNELDSYKAFLNLHEIKREKINPLNVGNYKKVIDMFFRYVRAGDIKLRVMYCPNKNLNQFRHGQDELYSKFYYTFYKRAFSLFYAREDINLKIFMDEFPESLKSKDKLSKVLISSLIKISRKNDNKVSLYKENIVQVDSKEHVILQCVDIVVGVIDFYLNTTEEQRKSKRAKAKIEMFLHIYNNYILELCPNFNFDISTGYFNCYSAWLSPYKHLVFKQLHT